MAEMTEKKHAGATDHTLLLSIEEALRQMLEEGLLEIGVNEYGEPCYRGTERLFKDLRTLPKRLPPTCPREKMS
jgi:hypothetical protein